MNTIYAVIMLWGAWQGEPELNLGIGATFTDYIESEDAKTYDMQDPVGLFELRSILMRGDKASLYISIQHITSIPDSEDKGLNTAFIGVSVKLK